MELQIDGNNEEQDDSTIDVQYSLPEGYVESVIKEAYSIQLSINSSKEMAVSKLDTAFISPIHKDISDILLENV